MKPAGRATGLVIVTHGQIGRAMIEVAEFILGQSLSAIRFISFQQSAVATTGDDEIKKAVESIDQGQGVLIMTDLGGASPYNNVSRLFPNAHATLISGLNLAMLIRVWNYRTKPMRSLAKLAIEGAMRDIREFEK